MRKLFLLALLVLSTAPKFAYAVALINPLGETDVRVIFARVISAALSIVGSLALLMFVYGGVMWLTSRGDTKQVDKGKQTLIWATLGIVIIFASYVIVNALITGITTGKIG
jgi:hypothetical protein